MIRDAWEDVTGRERHIKYCIMDIERLPELENQEGVG
jgi:hypothetical protein